MVCITENCKERAIYCILSNTKPLYCAKCKKEGMVLAKKIKKCNEELCSTFPLYNINGQKKGLYCNNHKKENMINVAHKKCLECNKIPVFNFKNNKTGIYCAEHKKENMIDITIKICIEKNCTKNAYYNVPNNKTKLYCLEHKKENMISTKSRCLEENCLISPIFNYIGCKSGIYCTKHKKENMYDVVTKNCINDNCLKKAYYCYIDDKKKKLKPLYCNEHKKENMYNIKYDLCNENDCKNIAFYNFKNENKMLYCFKHRKNNMFNLKIKLCKNKICDNCSNSRYDGYCSKCFFILNPDSKKTIYAKFRENNITDYLKNNITENNYKKMVFDKLIEGGKSYRRPDILIDKENYYIIIEIDEHQHNKYEKDNEKKRIKDIAEDLNNKNIIFIRFNPDSYIDKNNNKIENCWKINKSNAPVLKDKKIEEWNKRLNLLLERIKYWLNNVPNNNIIIEYLFYNENYDKNFNNSYDDENIGDEDLSENILN